MKILYKIFNRFLEVLMFFCFALIFWGAIGISILRIHNIDEFKMVFELDEKPVIFAEVR